jgi:hypothetical protein
VRALDVTAGAPVTKPPAKRPRLSTSKKTAESAETSDASDADA